MFDDVGLLMAEKIRQLPLGCQHAIKMLACVGSKCDELILRLFMREGDGSEGPSTKRRKHNIDGNDQLLMLDFAVEEGLLKKDDRSYIFAHDQIQHAAYSLIPENEQGRLHKHIGNLILKHIPDNRVNDVLFIV
eukprot:5500480-Ditylum_brightwellii.AAC.1